MNAPSSAEPRSGFVSVNGIRIHYLEWGSRDSPPALLLHGLRGHAHSWDDVSAALASNYRVLALDQRGRGETDWAPDGEYGTESFVADAVALCNALALTPVLLLGHSMGGRNGMMLASRHPERVSSFIIVDAGPEPSQKEGVARIRDEVVNAPEEFQSFEAAVVYVRAEDPLPPEDVLRRRVQYQTKELSGGKIGWRYDPIIRDQMRSNTRPPPPDFSPIWQTISCPILIVRGGESDILSRAAAERMCVVNPNATLVEIPRARHMVFEDDPKAFIDAVQGWLSR